MHLINTNKHLKVAIDTNQSSILIKDKEIIFVLIEKEYYTVTLRWEDHWYIEFFFPQMILPKLKEGDSILFLNPKTKEEIAQGIIEEVIVERHYAETEIINALKILNIAAEHLPKASYTKLEKEIVSRFLTVDFTPSHLWYCFKKEYYSVGDYGWTTTPVFLKNFLENKSVYLFFEREPTVFFFPKADQLGEVLGECAFMDDFYIVDPDMEFMICYTHHDFLIAMGTAEEALRRMFE